MAAIEITFQKPGSDPAEAGLVRSYPDDSAKVIIDRGCRPLTDVQLGWKIKRAPKEPWLTVFEIN